ncbi:MAG: hypothetical protein ABSG26_19330 [Bryobacteraceae bacterium]|jgi:hypothetical protein
MPAVSQASKGVNVCLPSLDSAAEWSLRQRTDADVLGIRFPHRQEVVGGEPLRDRRDFQGSLRTLFVIAEVKAGPCSLNGPWTCSKDGNVDHVLRALGCVTPESLGSISRSLYQNGRFESADFEARLLCFGARKSSGLPTGSLQFTWHDVFGFVYDRYQTFWRAKRQNQQWPPVGRFLWGRCRDRQLDAYVQEMLAAFGVGVS